MIVIGAGAAGLTAAGGCARLGLRVALIERDRMGGECLNTGCVPSKALIAAARRAAAMRGGVLGVSGAGPIVDFAAVRAHVDATIAAIAPHDSAARFAAWGVEVIRGAARLTGPQSVDVEGRALAAPRIVLATGSDPRVPEIEGLRAAPFLTNETLFDLDVLPGHLLVLGGGPSGVEMAQAFRRLGAAVTVLDAGPLLPRSDPEGAAGVRAALVADGVTVLEGTEVTRVEAESGGITIHGAAGPPVRGTHLLVATGRRARVDGLGLDQAGVQAGPDGITVDARCRTTNPAVFAVGDCRAGPRFTHLAGQEGTQVVSALGFGLSGAAPAYLLPSVTYTEPELAQLGLTEDEARARHGAVQVSREPFSGNDRAVCEGDALGFVKVVRRGRRVLGVTILGAGAGDLLLPWSLVLQGRAGLWALAGTTVPYPTRSEASKAAAFSVFEPLIFGRAARAWARSLAWARAQAKVRPDPRPTVGRAAATSRSG